MTAGAAFAAALIGLAPAARADTEPFEDLFGPLGSARWGSEHCHRSMVRRGRCNGASSPLPNLLSVVRGTTSPWPNRLATSSPTITWATSCPPSAAGSWSRRRAALPATTTPIPAGKSARSGAAAAIATWNGDAIAAERFTHRSRSLIADSATEPPSRCGRAVATALDQARSREIVGKMWARDGQRAASGSVDGAPNEASQTDNTGADQQVQKFQSSSSVTTALPITYDEPDPEKKSWFSSALGDNADRMAGLTSVSSRGNSAS
jgi:hypothetical protein